MKKNEKLYLKYHFNNRRSVILITSILMIFLSVIFSFFPLTIRAINDIKPIDKFDNALSISVPKKYELNNDEKNNIRFTLSNRIDNKEYLEIDLYGEDTSMPNYKNIIIRSSSLLNEKDLSLGYLPVNSGECVISENMTIDGDIKLKIDGKINTLKIVGKVKNTKEKYIFFNDEDFNLYCQYINNVHKVEYQSNVNFIDFADEQYDLYSSNISFSQNLKENEAIVTENFINALIPDGKIVEDKLSYFKSNLKNFMLYNTPINLTNFNLKMNDDSTAKIILSYNILNNLPKPTKVELFTKDYGSLLDLCHSLDKKNIDYSLRELDSIYFGKINIYTIIVTITYAIALIVFEIFMYILTHHNYDEDKFLIKNGFKKKELQKARRIIDVCVLIPITITMELTLLLIDFFHTSCTMTYSINYIDYLMPLIATAIILVSNICLESGCKNAFNKKN